MRAATGYTTPHDIPQKNEGKGSKMGGLPGMVHRELLPEGNTQELTDTELIDKHGNSLVIHTLLRVLGGESRERHKVL